MYNILKRLKIKLRWEKSKDNKMMNDENEGRKQQKEFVDTGQKLNVI